MDNNFFDLENRNSSPIKLRTSQSLQKKQTFQEKKFPKYTRLKTSFFESKEAKKFEEPEGENLGEFYQIRKNIIFNLINIKENEDEFAKLIFDSQSKLNKTMKKDAFFMTPRNVYNWALVLKETIANYVLVINSYFIAKKDINAINLFILMNIQNKEKIKMIFIQIKKYFKNMSFSNQIGKFYPAIIRIFLTILGVLIKLSTKMNKIQLENYYLRKYLLTIDIVRNTVSEVFITPNTGNDNDFKTLGRYLYFDCLYKQAIYSFIKYHSFEIIFFILNHIIAFYENTDDSVIINLERVLLLKTSYNLGLMLYAKGNNQEALSQFNKSISFLKNIYHFPCIVNQVIQDEIKVQDSNNQISSRSNQDKSTIDSFNINESFQKNVVNKKFSKRRSISTKIEYDKAYKNKELIFGLKQKCHSVLKFGKEKIIIIDTSKNIEIIIRELINIEIELIMAEIELSKHNYERAFLHINNILDIFNIPVGTRNTDRLHSSRTFQQMSQNIMGFVFDQNKYKKSKILELTELHKRRICFILEKIETNIEMIQNGKRYFYNSQKTLEVIKDISSYESSSSRENNIKNDKYYKYKNNYSFCEGKKLINAAEKFFLFICSLSLYQLKVLNEFQPEQSQKRDELPILFPSQFQDCLTFKQRLALNDLDSISLTRCMILVDSKKEISVKNLNYYFLSSRKKIKKNMSCMLGGDVSLSGYTKNYLKKIGNKIEKNKKEESISGSTNISMDFSANRKKYMKHYGINLMNNIKKKNLKQKMFIQGQFQKFMQEDDYFNSKLDEIIENDDKIKISKTKIYKMMDKLNPEDKEFLINDKRCVDGFVRNVKKTLHRSKSSYK